MRKGFRNSRWSLLLLIFLCAFALRVYRLGVPSLRGDEAFSAQFITQPYVKLIASLARYEPHPPFYYTLLALWRQVAGFSEFALRFLSVWWGTLFVVLAYDLGKRLEGERLGATVAVLAAVNPFLIWHSQEVRMYAALATLALASVVLLVWAWQRGGRGHLWWAWAAVMMLALFTHYFAVFLVVAELGFLTTSLVHPKWRGKRVAQLKAWAVPLAVVALLYLPWLIYVAPAMLGHEKSWLLSVGLGKFFRQILVTYSLGSTAAPWATQWLWPGFLLILLSGIAALVRRKRWETSLTGICFLAPLVIVYLLSLHRPIFDERYLISVLPLYLLILSLGITAWASQVQGRSRWPSEILTALPMAFLVGAAGLSLVNYYHHPSYARSPPWREMVQSLQAQSQHGDVVIQNYPDPSLTYYLAGRVPHALVPSKVPSSQQEVGQTLTDLMNEHRRLWLVPTRSADWDATGLVETWLDRHCDLSGQQQFGPLRLRLYLSPALFLEPGPPLARLGETMQLRGYRLSYKDSPVRPGDVLYLSLYWQTDTPLALSYTVFAHLLDPTGWLRGQQDNPPVGGTYPTTEWQPGEVIVDRYEITVSPDAPRGVYRLAVGLYDGTTLERLPARDVVCENCAVSAYASEDRVFLPVEIVVGETQSRSP